MADCDTLASALQVLSEKQELSAHARSRAPSERHPAQATEVSIGKMTFILG